MQEATKQEWATPPEKRNPDGRGGFADHPEHRNPGGRPKNSESFTFWMTTFKDMTVKEFLAWEKENPESQRTVAASIAYARVMGARTDLAEFKEVADRTEGKAVQHQDITSKGEKIGATTEDVARKLQEILAESDDAKPEENSSPPALSA